VHDRHADPPAPATPRPGELFRLASWVYLVMAVGGLLWIGWQRRAIPLELFVPRSAPWIDVAAGLGAAGALIAAWQVTLRWAPLARGLEERLRQTLGPLATHEALGLALLSGLGEEVFFRGAMQPAWGFVVTTVLFGVLHSGRGREMALWSVSALAAGAVLGGLMAWRGNLLAPVLCHVAVNAVQLRRILGRSQPE
jgi:membrane protease YdiL (CAAX protease family)